MAQDLPWKLAAFFFSSFQLGYTFECHGDRNLAIHFYSNNCPNVNVSGYI